MNAVRLLIVDDDRDFAEGLAEALELFDCPADLAFSGEDAVEAVGKRNFEVIFMDIGLPGLNGVESLSRIREIDPGARCFLMTGYSNEHLAEQGIEAGAIEVLTKPIEVEEVVRRIREGEGQS